MARCKLNNKGVSLVEALVASLIMAIGALLLMSGFLASAKLMDHSRKLEQGGQQTTGVVNGGIDGGASMTESKEVEVEMKIGGFHFVIEGGKVQQYTSNEDDGVTFYRYLPNTP